MLFSSCFSYHAQIDSQTRKKFRKTEKETAYVINPKEFLTEYNILKKSKMYNLTSDSATQLKIKINKLIRYRFRGCATPQATVLIFSLGQFPVYFEENFSYKLDEIRNDKIKQIELKLMVEKRVWFWDILSWRKNINRELSLSLRQEKMKKINLYTK
ncbi:MAG: hypothetical protein ACOYMA_18195 [Bacteroidia bacterium]